MTFLGVHTINKTNTSSAAPEMATALTMNSMCGRANSLYRY